MIFYNSKYDINYFIYKIILVLIFTQIFFNKRLSQRQQTGFLNIYLCPGNITRTITDER